ncbi:hypothetical protein DICVIV_02209 [Dictyocaulus viviparus]|uniref:Uncharacterized protein n=1 Tax=Dictyocaulus viviparus TaxID=29172 RepID=A0A0D8YAF7_DICVI|nr:hypothetical protein DICVIV_02209 [Dictyocaulus viviparus]
MMKRSICDPGEIASETVPQLLECRAVLFGNAPIHQRLELIQGFHKYYLNIPPSQQEPYSLTAPRVNAANINSTAQQQSVGCAPYLLSPCYRWGMVGTHEYYYMISYGSKNLMIVLNREIRKNVSETRHHIYQYHLYANYFLEDCLWPWSNVEIGVVLRVRSHAVVRDTVCIDVDADDDDDRLSTAYSTLTPPTWTHTGFSSFGRLCLTRAGCLCALSDVFPILSTAHRSSPVARPDIQVSLFRVIAAYVRPAMRVN